MNEYIIVNKTLIQKRLEELEKYYSITDFEEERRLARIDELEEILSRSTPLIPKIEKTYEAGRKLTVDGFEEEDFKDYKDYISNLKLDI